MLLIKQLRLSKGLSQLEVAKELKITVRMYQYIESGTRNPSWNLQKRMECSFGIPAGALLEEPRKLGEISTLSNKKSPNFQRSIQHKNLSFHQL